MNQLSVAARRTIAVGLLVLVLLFTLNFVFLPLHRASEQALDNLYGARLERLRLATLAQDAARMTPEGVRAQHDQVAADLFTTRLAPQAEGQFVAAVGDLIRSSGVRLQQLKAAPTGQVGTLARFTVELTASGTEAEAIRLLTQIEQHRPILVVERAVLVSQGSPVPGTLPDTPPTLSLDLRISAFGAELNLPASREGRP